MAAPKRHHFLPKSYLNRFCREGFMWVYDREKHSYRHQQPLNTAVISHHYAFTDDEGRKNTDIESFLSRLEGESKPVIDKIDVGELPTAQEDGILAAFVAYLKMRVPDTEQAIIGTADELTKKVLDQFMSTEESIRAVLERYQQALGGKADFDPKEILGHLQSGDLEVSVETPRGFYFGTMIEGANRMVPVLLEMNWLFLQAPCVSSFITSDCPFTITPPEVQPVPALPGYGILTPTTKKLVPLSQTTMLVINDPGNYRGFETIGRADVRKFNVSTAICCDRWLYARDKELLESIVRRTKLNEWRHGPRFKVS